MYLGFSTDRTVARVPSDNIKRCPVCDDPKLLRFDGEAFCTLCDWDSIASTFEAIGLGAFRLGARRRRQEAEVSIDSLDHDRIGTVPCSGQLTA